MSDYTGPLTPDGLIPREVFEDMMIRHDIVCALSGVKLTYMSQKYGHAPPPESPYERYARSGEWSYERHPFLPDVGLNGR